MALGSGTAEVGSCREAVAAVLVVAGVVYVFWFGVFFTIWRAVFQGEEPGALLTPGGCGLNEPRLRKLGAALPCLSNTGEEEVVLCAGLGSSEGR